MSQYHYSNNANSFNNVWNNCTVADERSSLLTWLSPLNPRLRHQDVQEHRVENVGGWLLHTEEFRNWYTGSGEDESDNPVLFCYGDPGVGKTYISSLVIDSLCDQTRGQNTTVACFYFNFAAQKEQTSTSMLGALLKQLVGGLEAIPEEISRAYQDQKSAIGGRGLRFPDIVKMLQATSSEKRTFICIDALDECGADYRAKVFDSLNQILQKSPGTRIFVTGRPQIRAEIGMRLTRRVTSVSILPRRDDIIIYLHNRLAQDSTPDAMDSSLEADILEKIPDNISEMYVWQKQLHFLNLFIDSKISRFLLVSLNIEAILQEPTIHRRRQKLNAMTDGLGLGDAYSATLNRIKRQSGEKTRLGMAALMWTSHSERPLEADELCYALAVEIGSPNFNADNIPSIGTLLTCCQGLIAVDKKASTVRLIHFTLKEYLRAHPEIFGTAHSTMAETCLSYLNSQEIRALPTSTFSLQQDMPFLKYASLYWGIHAKKKLSDCAKSLVFKLFDNYSDHISVLLFLFHYEEWFEYEDGEDFSSFTGLHCASAFGLDEIVTALVDVEGCDINQKDPDYRTPLAWAALHGHEGVVEILLKLEDIKPDMPDILDRTPLSHAAENGHEGVVEILLEHEEVNPDNSDYSGLAPFCCAAWNGHEGVVKILLKREVNPHKVSEFGTSLHLAAEMGHEGVVKILLEREEVNPETRDENGETPLQIAHRYGYGRVAALLQSRMGGSSSAD